ncbi:MAG: septum formation initiator family protein [Clostridia bacterium]|nr:septum formation initiator family protein [Clostridia bacterium]
MTETRGRRSIILILSVIAILCFSLVIFSWITIDSNEKQIQLDSLNAQLQQLQQENQEIDHLINDADEAELYEHLARERGYAYPDEKVYYDVTPGK